MSLMPGEIMKQSSHATIFATAFPAPGKEREWEQAIGELLRTSMSFPGHQGSMVLKPESEDQPHYRVITRFDTLDNMRRWYESDERREKVSHLEPFEQHVSARFDNWLAQQENRGRKFTGDQLWWLQAIRDVIATDLAADRDIFEDSPFIQKGGLGKAYQLFGEELDSLLDELSEALVA